MAAFFWTDLWIGLALIKFNGGSDILSAEPWRLLTVALVHGSPLEAGIGAIQGTAVHLFFNLFALDLGARLVFRLYGVGRLLLWYGLGVVAASLASAIWPPTTPSVGASGGVFALFGIAFATLGSSSLANVLYFNAVPIIGPARTANFQLLVPFLAVIVSVIVSDVVRVYVIVTLSKGKNYAYLQHQSEFYFSIHRAALLA